MGIPVTNGFHLKKNIVGKHLENYDSILMLSHFKGHQMAGMGGALKNMSIGIASTKGKLNIHLAGKTLDQNECWNNLPAQDDFLESMADACQAVMNYKGAENIVYINVANNLLENEITEQENSNNKVNDNFGNHGKSKKI